MYAKSCEISPGMVYYILLCFIDSCMDSQAHKVMKSSNEFPKSAPPAIGKATPA